MPVVVRQLVLPRPPRDLFGLAIRPAVAVLLAAIALVEEPLIVALELVVEDDAPDPSALAPESLLGALVGAIDLGVVRQLARLPEAGVEGLAGLVRCARGARSDWLRGDPGRARSGRRLGRPS